MELSLKEGVIELVYDGALHKVESRNLERQPETVASGVVGECC